MPLPTPNAPWPPPELRPALDRMATWDAWWSGDPAQLQHHYQRAGNATARPSQHAGGVAGFLSRMWWGRPTPDNEPDAKLHVPLAGDIVGAYAHLLFGEPISVRSEHKATNTRLAELVDDGLHAQLLEAAETVGALGGGWLRPMHDPEVSDRPWVDAVAPDAGQPEWRGGRAVAVNLWSVVATDGDGSDRLVWRHIERHERGRIVHALYQGSAEKIGRPVPLTESAATEHLAAQVDDEGAIATGWDGLSCVYVPRVRPNRRWRHLPALAPMGRSLFDGAEPLFDAIDETYSSLMRDVRLAKGRVIVGEGVLEDLGRGRGAAFDPDREVFYQTAGMAKDTPITAVQFDVRVEKLLRVTGDLINASLRHCGLNASTLGEPGEDGPAMTAREVLSRERRSMLTRETGIRYWRPELGPLLGATLALDRRAFKRNELDPRAPITVSFPDTVTDDPTHLANTAEVLFRGQTASRRERVQIVHPDWDETRVNDEVDALADEFGAEPIVDAPFPGDERDLAPAGGPAE